MMSVHTAKMAQTERLMLYEFAARRTVNVNTKKTYVVPTMV